jgi:hypothetical protein
MLLPGLYQYLASLSSVTALLGTAGDGGPAIYFSAAPKQPPVPFLVLHKVNTLPAGQTLDGVSALIDGEIQFDAYANDAITAQGITTAVRTVLANYADTMAEGTQIQFVAVVEEFDAGYEEGDSSYLYRSILRLRAFYTETGIPGPAPGGSVTLYQLTPAPGGGNRVFTAPVAVSASAILARNGEIQAQRAGGDYTVSGVTITFATAPGSGDSLQLFQ